MDWPDFVGQPKVGGVLGVPHELCGAHPAVYASTASSGTWPVASKAIFIPFYLLRHQTVKQLAHYNGSTVAAGTNIDMGIYDDAGARIVSIGSTAQSGVTQIQTFNIVDTLLEAGDYYLAVALDTNTNTSLRWNLTANYLRVCGVQEAATSFPLPSSVTYANPAAGFLPYAAAVFVSVL